MTFGKGVALVVGIEVGVSPPEYGWKGVSVGVAFDGAVTRNKVVGVAAGSAIAGVFPKGAAQLAIMKMMSSNVRRVRLIKILQRVGIISD
jgi:hypothetical protein